MAGWLEFCCPQGKAHVVPTPGGIGAGSAEAGNGISQRRPGLTGVNDRITCNSTRMGTFPQWACIEIGDACAKGTSTPPFPGEGRK
jgi:hypothetical protein